MHPLRGANGPESNHLCAGCGIGVPGSQAGGNLHVAALGISAPARYSRPAATRFNSRISLLGHAAMVLLGVVLVAYALAALVLVSTGSAQTVAGHNATGFASLDPTVILRRAANGLLYSVLPLCAGVSLVWTGLGRSPGPGLNDTSPAGFIYWLAAAVRRNLILRVAALTVASCLMVAGFFIALHAMWLLGEPGISQAIHVLEALTGLVVILAGLSLCRHSLHPS